MSDYNIETFDFSSMSADECQQTLQEYRISLTPTEAVTLQATILKREPTLAECILWSIQGSEHCSYKSSRNHLKTLSTQGENVIIGAKEDAGIIAIAKDKQGKRYGLAISHESHNHPSQIVPYEGAATGVGGNVRDVMCMGAEVIALADDLRFGEVDRAQTQWIQEGVVAGIAGYGNPLGIPNVAGGLYYHQGYNDNCLVTIVTLGIVAEDDIIHSYAPDNAVGYDLILVGKPTDNSGFGGASFSSLELEEEKLEQNKGAVQEPNAFLERHLLKSSYALFNILKEKNLIDKVAFKDLGAGGVACAGVEIAETAGYGAVIYLDDVHVGMENLHPSVILCSETQERFMWAVPKEVTPLILEHYNKTFALPQVSHGAKASVVGEITADKKFRVIYQGKTIVDALAADVVEGIVFDRPAQAAVREHQELKLAKQNLQTTFAQVMQHKNAISRQFVYDNYDKQVQGRVVLERGQNDAGVLQPYNNKDYPAEIQSTGVALALAQNPQYSLIDPYWATVNAVLLACMRVAAVGATPQAITDCLCFGNPEKPAQMHDFVESVKALKETCEAFQIDGLSQKGLPIVAGNVSFYNESKQGAIPASPMISAVGVMPDAQQAVSHTLKSANSTLLLIGERKDECGGSLYYHSQAQLGVNLPKPPVKKINQQIDAVVAAIQQSLLLSSKVISDGGLALACQRMMADSDFGIVLNIESTLTAEQVLFSETPGFVLEVANANLSEVQAFFAEYQVATHIIGETIQDKQFQFNNTTLTVKG